MAEETSTSTSTPSLVEDVNNNDSSSTKDDTKEEDVPPNHTLYAQNLNEKIKIDDLKKSLYHAFSRFGNILEIFAAKRLKTKGQAWIVFDDLTAATKALREMKDTQFYGKAMRVSYAKAKSDIVAKIDGTFQPRPKRTAEDAKSSKKGKKNKDRGANGSSGAEQSKKKKARTETSSSSSSSSSSDTKEFKAEYSAPDIPTPPNKVLFIENLPAACTGAMLQALFDKFHGFVEARMVPGKPGIAFVEYHDLYQSGQAKDSLQGYRMDPTHGMKITFAK